MIRKLLSLLLFTSHNGRQHEGKRAIILSVVLSCIVTQNAKKNKFSPIVVSTQCLLSENDAHKTKKP